MNTISAILVDDEQNNLKGLERKLGKLYPNITILNTFSRPENAISALQNQQPDILFLDIQMPRINGFELLSKLSNINFQVIFVTAYSDYAIKAFKLSAVDYLLKPVDDDDLKLAVEKAIAIIEKNKLQENNNKLLQLLTENIKITNKIMIPTTKGISFIPQDDLLHLEGTEGYTKLHLISGENIISSYNLGKFEKILNPQFFKCHKSHIINLSKVSSFENEGAIILEDDTRVPISKTNKEAFLSLFK